VLQCMTVCRAMTTASLNSVINLRVGDDIRFPVDSHSGVKYEVTFKRKSPVNIKILAWNSERPEKPYRIHPHYTHRVQFQPGGFIEIQNAVLVDGGEYEVQADYLGSRLRSNDYDRFELRVFEPVSQPVVAIGRDCTLNCSYARGTQVTCYWKRQSADGVGSSTFRGALLQRGNTSELGILTYTCIVENPISVEISEPFTLGQCVGDRPRGPRNYWMVFLAPAVSLATILGFVIVLGIRREGGIVNSKVNR
ncbi:hypothetical protein scyTo_0024204, partial [Scyliorhinus torazame]|nr:hypothetical protein [Scyliorhinus torazame]